MEGYTQHIYRFFDSVISIIRMIFQSRLTSTTLSIRRKHPQCLILGNGPSLANTLNENKDILKDYDLIAVNYMGLDDNYKEWKPSAYILCDPAFFSEENIPESIRSRVQSLYGKLIQTTNWELDIYFPYRAQKNPLVWASLHTNKNIKINFFNKTNVCGYTWLQNLAYDKQWGMPRAQNVVIASIMIALHSKYTTIFLSGAEHDWLKNLRVNEKNQVVTVLEHFYSDQKYWKLISNNLPEQLYSLYMVFRNYWEIEKYARKKHQKIYNVTPESYIDAFERKQLE